MRVVITGGGGFLGTMLCRALLQRGVLTSPATEMPQSIQQITLLDSQFAGPPVDDPRVQQQLCEIRDRQTVFGAINQANDLPGSQPGDLAVFHLASMVSGECELKFDDCWQVNLDGTRHLLEAVRLVSAPASAAGKQPCRLVFASSIACFGGDEVAELYDDQSKLLPGTSYGVTKAICELLINDYARKGFVDGRSARLPTVIIRPGQPNAAASSWASGMFREPLGGVDCRLPVHRQQRHPMTDYRTVIQSLIQLHELPAQRLGRDRAVGLPAVTVTPEDAWQAVSEVAAQRGLAIGRLVDEFDPRIQAIVDGWPTAIDGGRGRQLGLPSPLPLRQIVENYLADFALAVSGTAG